MIDYRQTEIDNHRTLGSSSLFFAAWLLIAVAVFASYSNAFKGPFLFDDLVSIVNNRSIRSVWPLSKSMWGPHESPSAGRPVANLSFAYNYALGKLDVAGYHLVNILLHSFNAGLLMLVVHRGLSTVRDPKTAWWTSVIVTAVWALHPLQTEAVTYVTQRTELLMAFFLLATLWSAIRAWDAKDRVTNALWQSIAILCCALGMASKEVMVIAPVIVAIYDFTILRSPFAVVIKRRWVLYIGLAATWLVLAALMATNPRIGSVGFGLSIAPLDYLTTQFWAIAHYLRLAVWPADLCADYGVVTITRIKAWLPCLALLIVLTVLTLWTWFRCRPLSFWGFFFFVVLAPTSSIVPIATEPIAERRMYLSLASVIVFMILVAIEGTKRLPLLWDILGLESSRRPYALMIFAVIVSAAGGWATHLRNEVFLSELSFWKDVTKKRPENARAWNALGVVHVTANKVDLGKEDFEKALAIDPKLAKANSNLGVWFMKSGKIDQAIDYLERAISVDPSLFRTQCCLAKCYADRGRVDKAKHHYDLAIALEPDMPEALLNRGELLSNHGFLKEAIEDYQRVIKSTPKVPQAYLLLGNAYFNQQRSAEAIAMYRTALELEPRMTGAYLNLGTALAQSGECAEAIQWLNQALAMESKNADAYNNLGFCFTSLGRFEEAIAAYTHCVALKPDDFNAWYSLGKIHVDLRHFDEARACFERVLQLQPTADEARRDLEQLQGK